MPPLLRSFPLALAALITCCIVALGQAAPDAGTDFRLSFDNKVGGSAGEADDRSI